MLEQVVNIETLASSFCKTTRDLSSTTYRGSSITWICNTILYDFMASLYKQLGSYRILRTHINAIHYIIAIITLCFFSNMYVEIEAKHIFFIIELVIITYNRTYRSLLIIQTNLTSSLIQIKSKFQQIIIPNPRVWIP